MQSFEKMTNIFFSQQRQLCFNFNLLQISYSTFIVSMKFVAKKRSSTKIYDNLSTKYVYLTVKFVGEFHN